MAIIAKKSLASSATDTREQVLNISSKKDEATSTNSHLINTSISSTSKSVNFDTANIHQLAQDGWIEQEAGYYWGHNHIEHLSAHYRLFVRKTEITDMGSGTSGHEQIKCSYRHGAGNTINKWILRSGATDVNGKKGIKLPPSLSAYPSLSALRENRSYSLDISFCAFCDDPGLDNYIDPECTISWNFSVIYGSLLYEFIFLRSDKDLSINIALGVIFDTIGLTSYRSSDLTYYEGCTGFTDDGTPITTGRLSSRDEACAKSTYIYDRSSKESKGWHFAPILIANMPSDEKNSLWRDRNWSKCRKIKGRTDIKNMPVTLICYDGLRSLSTFNRTEKKSDDPIQMCSDINGGTASTHKTTMHIKSFGQSKAKGRNKYVYPISLTIVDALCHAPAGKSALNDLGDIVGIKRTLSANNNIVKDLKALLINNPASYFDCTSRDCLIPLAYVSAIYGSNRDVPLTLISAATDITRKSCKDYFGVKDDKTFDRVFRGMEYITVGKEQNGAGKYSRKKRLRPISPDAADVIRQSCASFKGGLNISSVIGYFDSITLDYDMIKAYATAMVLVPDIDWKDPTYAHKGVIHDADLSLNDFIDPESGKIDPFRPFVGRITFHFPNGVKYPSLPVYEEGVPVFPLNSTGCTGGTADVCGPELYLALKLGATVHCHTGYFLKPLKIIDSVGRQRTSYSLRYAVKGICQDRDKAVASTDKGSLEDLLLKTMIVSMFGKLGQNVRNMNDEFDIQTWNQLSDFRKKSNCSGITNPVSACLITAIVRAALIAACNEITSLGYHVYSVTTDGCISDLPHNMLENLTLFGFSNGLKEARRFLTDENKSEIWEIKHVQDDLLNSTTRGNTSRYDSSHPFDFDGKEFKGVNAHNGLRSPYERDSYEDRTWMMTKVLSRQVKVHCEIIEHTSLNDIKYKKSRYRRYKEGKDINMGFDLKRKPVRDSFVTVYPVIDGVQYEIANFETEPYKDINEYRLYRNRRNPSNPLRTIDDWHRYFLKVDGNLTAKREKNSDWLILWDCIMLCRMGIVSIPVLDEGSNLTVAEKCAWIMSHNTSDHNFDKNTWKDARKPDRQKNFLPFELLKPKLTELGGRIIDPYMLENIYKASPAPHGRRAIAPAEDQKKDIPYIYDRYNSNMSDEYYLSESDSAEGADPITLLLSQCDVSTDTIKAIHRQQDDVYGILTQNPYSGLEYGMAFNSCEKLAYHLGIEPWDDRRIDAYINRSLDYLTKDGSTRAIAEILSVRIAHLSSKSPYPDGLISTQMITTRISNSNTFYSDGTYVSLASSHDMEVSILNKCTNANAKGCIVSSADIDMIERKLQVNYDSSQRKAFSLLGSSTISVLTGGPGTGKTSVIKGLVEAFRLHNPKAKIKLCAFTGRAATNIKEKVGVSAFTIHLMLTKLEANNSNQLNADLVIVDEATLVNLDLMYRLFAVIPQTAKIILCGDNDQLPAVGHGNVMHDLIMSHKVDVVKLRFVHRQGEGSSIISNARDRVLNGLIPVNGCDTHMIPAKSYDDAINKVLTLFNNIYSADDPFSTQILTPSRTGTSLINDGARKLLRHDMTQKFTRGEKVMFTKNNWPQGYVNGQMGTYWGYYDGEFGIYTDKKMIYVTEDELKHVTPAYACTVHKSQGGEYDTVIVCITDKDYPLLSRNMLYTAITRARKNVYIVYTNSAMDKALSTVCMRDTWLSDIANENEAEIESAPAIEVS